MKKVKKKKKIITYKYHNHLVKERGQYSSTHIFYYIYYSINRQPSHKKFLIPLFFLYLHFIYLYLILYKRPDGHYSTLLSNF